MNFELTWSKDGFKLNLLEKPGGYEHQNIWVLNQDIFYGLLYKKDKIIMQATLDLRNPFFPKNNLCIKKNQNILI